MPNNDPLPPPGDLRLPKHPGGPPDLQPDHPGGGRAAGLQRPAHPQLHLLRLQGTGHTAPRYALTGGKGMHNGLSDIHPVSGC